jgi:trehalose synthase
MITTPPHSRDRSPPAHEVEVPPLSLDRLDALLSAGELRRFGRTLERAAATLEGRTIWNVSSTAVGGGVAQMLRTSLGYAGDAGISARWMVIGADPAFFTLTKRLHHLLHGRPGDGGPLGAAERALYDETLAVNAAAIGSEVRPGDVVVLHDPQTAGLVPPMQELGATVVWRSHIGADAPGAAARRAWSFLGPAVRAADAWVFSSRPFVWPMLDQDRVHVITPAIDAVSAKNLPMLRSWRTSILSRAGLMDPHGEGGRSVYLRHDGTRGEMRQAVQVLQERRLPAQGRYVLHLSRWDPLKDPLGVLTAFERHVMPRSGADLVLAGPAPGTIADDPESEAVLGEVEAAWHALDERARARVHVVRLLDPGGEETDALINALQRGAAVVVKKSLAEGFGLGTTEALWKRRPVVAAAVGGLREQVLDGVTGLLVDDPEDLRGFSDAVVRVLDDPALGAQLGAAGHRRVRRSYLEPRHLSAWIGLLAALAGSSGRPATESA